MTHLAGEFCPEDEFLPLLPLLSVRPEPEPHPLPQLLALVLVHLDPPQHDHANAMLLHHPPSGFRILKNRSVLGVWSKI